MNKKLQVFISSTFKDLQDERQAAVEAILSAGHIPAGMELFKAGNDSQLDVIKRWIDESDVYMLILGGRYGSIEKKSGKSYTHLEYEYAVDKGIPVFAVVMNKSALDEKLKEMSSEAIEVDNPDKYKKFKVQATSRMSSFFDDTKDIKIAIYESLREIELRYKLHGWISGKEMPEVSGLNEEIIKLQKENLELFKENQKLKEANGKLAEKQKDKTEFNGLTYKELKALLKLETVTLPQNVFTIESTLSLLDFFIKHSSRLANGVTNNTSAHAQSKYIFAYVVPKYIQYGLMEKVKATGGKYDKIHTSKSGHKFLAMLQKEIQLSSSNDETAATEE
ncbi:DUF4062 domain-containing protein [Brevibacillus brevis]|uniref:DUF4062 domain-containing protein n=1 Tax=Brevibacillus brevis TaxID=1393 RepID=UPI0007D8BCF1|nr:DUF4062 domain-containing protein [Brevibacillus brevis]